MKNILFKTLCLTSTLSMSMIPLVSCTQTINEGDYKNEITSTFFTEVKDAVFNKQIKQTPLWKQFSKVFHTHEDTQEGAGANWRGEFWGKMMRGAVMCYKYSHDEELYNILTDAVANDEYGLLKMQDTEGRISTYSIESGLEFTSWDMWGRKYVMTSLLHYYDICKDESLKTRIITALENHADYILEHIGNGPNQKPITETGYRQWKGLNSCTILEPMVNLYEVTHEKRYLDFATYIINTGGVSKGNMISDAKANKDPWKFPVRKAYESMSFFEGVYRYGKVVKDASLIQAALNYFTKIAEQEITIIGSGGYEEEQWHHGAEFQTLTHDGQGWPFRWGQETCVTVTWMRILNILYEETQDIKYYQMFANSAMNAFLGAFNVFDQPVWCWINGVHKKISGFPFDTYSPLCYEGRGIDGGGIVKFLNPEDTKYEIYGCCQCNAPIVVGLMGINYCRQFGDKLYLNDYFAGKVTNTSTQINIAGNYEVDGMATIAITSTSDNKLILRIPEWANIPTVTINGVTKSVTPGTYFDAGALKNITSVSVDFNPEVQLNQMNDKVYLTYGQYVLAYDGYNNSEATVGSIRDIQIENIDLSTIHQLAPAAQDHEIVRFEVDYKKDAETTVKLILTNFSSAGRHCYKADGEDTEKSMVNVFFRNDY